MLPRTILVVDDEPQIRGLIRNVLERERYRVLEAEDGRQALAICEKSGAKIDLLLTDIVMPHVDGVELAQRVYKELPHVRVIYMSGHCEIAIVDRDIRQRGFGFLRKPFALKTVIETVRKALSVERKTPGKPGESAAKSRTA